MSDRSFFSAGLLYLGPASACVRVCPFIGPVGMDLDTILPFLDLPPLYCADC